MTFNEALGEDRPECACPDGLYGENCDRKCSTKVCVEGNGDCVVDKNGAFVECKCKKGYFGLAAVVTNLDEDAEAGSRKPEAGSRKSEFDEAEDDVEWQLIGESASATHRGICWVTRLKKIETNTETITKTHCKHGAENCLIKWE